MDPIQNDPLDLDAYIMPNGRAHSQDESLLQDGHSPLNNASLLNAFSDFAMNYQNGAFNGPQMNSPAAATTNANSFRQPNRGSVSNISDSHHSLGSSAKHRLSINSNATETKPDLRHGSVDGSEANISPDGFSSGMNLLDENPEGSTGAMDNNDGDSMEDIKLKKDDKGEAPPPWSEMKTKAGKERKRLPLACIACRRKKIRCSGEKPACKHCLRSRIPCVYKVTTRKAAPRTDYMAMLDKRLKRMEDRVIKLIPKENMAAITGVGRAVVKPPIPGAPAKAPNKKRPAEEAFGQELDSWSKTKTVNPAEGVISKNQDADDTQLLTEGAESLPPKDIQEHLAEVYFDYVYGQSYPLLHKPSFMRKLNAGTVPPVLILAVCAISARFSSHPQLRTEPAFLRGENWATKAREISLKRYDSPNITILIVYLLLGLHEFGTCQGGRSWMFGGMAQRMAYALQLHKDLEYDPRGGENGERVLLSPTDREIRRRTMWSCFLMDRFNSSGTDRPLFVNEQFIQTQLPIREHFFQMEISGPTESLEGGAAPSSTEASDQLSMPKENMGVIAYLIRLVTIWGQLVRYMNLGGRAKDPYPMWHPDSTYQSLKRQTHEWKATLPDCLQYNEETLQTHAAEKTANQFLYLHIMYWQVILFMNRFALPAPPGIRSEENSVQEFFAEAARKAFDAASQISILINEAMDYNVVAPFAGYSAFFSSTVHIFGVFSKNPKLESTSKKYLAYNVKYLSKMKKYWGMLNFVAENLKELYRQHADNVLRGAGGAKGAQANIFQYGDWFDRYPHGVSKTDYEDPATDIKKEAGTDAVLGQKSDLQSVEEFFASLSPPSKAEAARKMAKKGKHVRSSSKPDIKETTAVPEPKNRRLSQATKDQQQAMLASHARAQHHNLQQDPAFAGHPSAASNAFLLQQQQHHQHHHLSSADYADIPSAAYQHAHQHHPQPGHHHPNLMDFASGAAFQNLDPASAALLSSNSSASALNFWPSIDMSLLTNGFNPMTNEPAGAWFMPFNCDPPDIGNDGGIFAGAEYGFGGFGGLGGGNTGPSGSGAVSGGLVEGEDDLGELGF